MKTTSTKPAKSPMRGFPRILIPPDVSASSVDALRFALPFARETGARLDLLRVIESVSGAGCALRT